ncbi:MAG: DsbA family protein [Maricaulaceae bacterium]|jgi:protein-disulfide isomerase
MPHLLRTVLSRRAVAGAAAALGAIGLAACGEANGASNEAGEATSADNVLGDPDAPITIIEYASTTCPHCKAFHDDVFPELKARYIDTGQVKLVFREMPTSPGPLSAAGMMTAHCAGPDQYFDVLDALFDRQVPLVQAYMSGGDGAREGLLEIAQAAGLSEAEFEACIRDEAGIERIQAAADSGRDFGVNTTPSFIIDGELLHYTGYPTIDDFIRRLDPLLAQ